MTVLAPEFHQNTGSIYTAEQMRRVMRWLAGNSRKGPLKLGDYAVTQNGTPNMSVNVASGDLGLLGTETTGQGLYYFLNDATKNVTISAADGTNPRNTLIVGRIRDQFYSGSNNDGDVIAVDGSPAPSPVDPTAPANSEIIARVRVNAGATSITNSNITDLRVWRDQRILPGSAGWFVRNSADSADNLAMTDAGLVTLRNALVIPPSAAGTPASSSYGTVPVKLDEQTPTGTSATFSSIPSGFKHLQIIWQARYDAAATSQLIKIRFNGDSGSNYDSEEIAANGASINGTERDAAATAAACGSIAGANAPSGESGAGTIWIQNYAGTTFRKKFTSETSYKTGDSAGNQFGNRHSGTWRSTAAITSITIIIAAAGNFVTGTVFSLYGIP